MNKHVHTINKAIMGPSTQQFFSSSSDVIATTCFDHTIVITYPVNNMYYVYLNLYFQGLVIYKTIKQGVILTQPAEVLHMLTDMSGRKSH
jgi:hypothetical protein